MKTKIYLVETTSNRLESKDIFDNIVNITEIPYLSYIKKSGSTTDSKSNIEPQLKESLFPAILDIFKDIHNRHYNFDSLHAGICQWS